MVSVNKLQFNLLKTKELVFRRANVHLDIVPAQLDNVERLEYVKLLGVFILIRAVLHISR